MLHLKHLFLNEVREKSICISRQSGKWVALLLLVCLNIGLFAKDNLIGYVEGKLKKGEGAIALLSRYNLMSHNCNLTEFFEINGLSKNAILRPEISYKLPIKVFTYNGQSIRSTVGNNDWNKAVEVQDYNKWLQSNKVKSTYYTSDKRLYVPHHIYNCNSDKAIIKPAVAEKLYVYHPLFGPAGNNKVEKIDDKLKGRVYYLMSGHGGPDPGAMKRQNGRSLCEDEYAYDVTLRLARNLMQHGATVHMIIQDKNDGIRDEQYLICDKDERSYYNAKLPLNQKQRLNQRASSVNKLYKKEKAEGKKKHIVVAIHIDSRHAHRREDVFFYHSPGSRSGKKIANQLQSVFRKKYQKHRPGRPYRGAVTPRGLYVLRKTNPPAVYVELANLQNPSDQKRILQSSNRQALANWLFEGLSK